MSCGGIPDLRFFRCDRVFITHQEVQHILQKSGFHSPRNLFSLTFFLYDVDMIGEFLLNDFNCSDMSPLITVHVEYAYFKLL